MISRNIFVALLVLVAIGLLATLQPTTSTAINLKSGAVYVLTNQVNNALNNGSRFLYVLANGLQTVEAFRVNPDGSLTKIDSVGGLPFGTQGIAAR